MKRSVLGWLALFGCTEQSDEMDWDTAVSAETGGGNPTETGSDSGDTGVVQDIGQSDAEDIEEAVAFTVHVAPWGDDNDLGTEGAPLATLEGARDAIRSFKNAAEIQGSLVVVIHAGTYTLDSTFELNAQDSGTEDAPIHYRSAEGSVVRITGGRALAAQDFVPVSNSAILDRLVDS